ncbi:uncharacterized protein LOC62_02G002097 [Vanrija pseudolonga]|uniref:Uncharacterized protein n=1 Tax=Vanrija pseudolonga TaxID=143232 RepID=A0AAF0Y1Y9_9TREE|nr:hypothetical protein LOC62_02G002097 [Vanrija pseudolonga]
MPRYRISKPLPVGTGLENSSVASGSGAAPPTTPTAATSSTTAPQPPPRNPARSAPLSPVPEIKAGSTSPPPATQRVRPPPSAFRPVAPAVARSNKGKERSRDDQQLFPTRNGRAQWIVDPIESRRGAEIWEASERVILILGEPARMTLTPLLYSKAFANTLLLIGSVNPLPDIEALLSPSHLLNGENGKTIYPTVQPFTVPQSVLDQHSHPLPAFLNHAAALAEDFRKNGGLAPSPSATIPNGPAWSSRSRRSSGSSASGTLTPPLTPLTTRKRFSPFSRGSYASTPPSLSPRGSVNDLTTRYSASSSNSRPPSVMSNGERRPSSIRRIGSLFREDGIPVSEGSPFDAVINFIPSATRCADPSRVLQEMLQSAVVLTTAVLPMLTKVTTNNSLTAAASPFELAPLSLVHIVPLDAPPTLAPVIERFLLPLLPPLKKRVRRDLFACVTSLGAWLAPQTETMGEGLPGAETILFGGVRCYVHLSDDGGAQQAMLAGWEYAVSAPNVLVENSQKAEAPPPFLTRSSSQTLSELRQETPGYPLSPPSPQALKLEIMPEDDESGLRRDETGMRRSTSRAESVRTESRIGGLFRKASRSDLFSLRSKASKNDLRSETPASRPLPSRGSFDMLRSRFSKTDLTTLRTERSDPSMSKSPAIEVLSSIPDDGTPTSTRERQSSLSERFRFRRGSVSDEFHPAVEVQTQLPVKASAKTSPIKATAKTSPVKAAAKTSPVKATPKASPVKTTTSPVKTTLSSSQGYPDLMLASDGDSSAPTTSYNSERDDSPQQKHKRLPSLPSLSSLSTNLPSLPFSGTGTLGAFGKNSSTPSGAPIHSMMSSNRGSPPTPELDASSSSCSSSSMQEPSPSEDKPLSSPIVAPAITTTNTKPVTATMGSVFKRRGIKF